LLEGFGFVGLFMVVAIGFAALMILLPVAFRFMKLVPNHPSAVKNSPFECGMQTIGPTWVQYNFHYYYYALVFVALDVLVIFLYPWAVELRSLGATGMVNVLVFIAIVMVAFVYAWKKRVLEWK
jgi:NADH-quinone oxidoreductase subunit A